MDDSEPQKRKRCDSGTVAGEIQAPDPDSGVSIAKKRPTPSDVQSPASPDADSPASPIESPASPPIYTSTQVADKLNQTVEDGEIVGDDNDDDDSDVLNSSSDDCLLLEKTIPLVVVSESEAEATASQPQADTPASPEPQKVTNADNGADENDEDDDGDCLILDKTVPLIVLDNDPDDEGADAEDPDSPPIEPLMRITFRDSDTADRLQFIVLQAIRSALFRHKIIVDMPNTDPPPASNELIISETSGGRATGFKTAGANAACAFIIDAAPSENKRKPTTGDVPEYSVNVSQGYDLRTLISKGGVEDDEDRCRRSARPRNVCFNCDGDHNMRDCTEPRNVQKIRENRQQFGSRQERYHVDANQFGHFEPGQVSAELRQALGLRDGDLPMHVYRMRLFGYPPGWLESARVSGSGLTLFDDKGNDVTNGTSTGAANTSKENDADEFDLKKIHSFPGFNVQPDEGCIDLSYSLRMPPMQEHQSKANMLRQLRTKSSKSYKRQKNVTNIPIADVDTGHVDLSNPTMDIDDHDDGAATAPADETDEPPVPGCDPPPPPMAPEKPPSPPSSPDCNSSASIDSRAISPSLNDLRQQQEQLIGALNDSSSVQPSASTVADDSLIDDIMALDDTQTSCLSTTNLDESLTGTTPTTASATAIEPTTPTTPATPVTPLNSSKHSVSGTPLLQSASPFTQLPAGANWSVGVSDIIDFENLADSVGKFERMKDLIKKVRVTVKELNDEYDV